MSNNRFKDNILKFAKGITVALLNYLLAFAVLLQDYPMTSIENFYDVSRIPVAISVVSGLLVSSLEGLIALAGMIFFFLSIFISAYFGIYLAGTNLLIVFLGISALLLIEFLVLLILRIVKYTYRSIISSKKVR